MLGAREQLANGQQRGEPVAGLGRIPRRPGLVGEVRAGGQGVRVHRAQDPLLNGQQGGELVAGLGRIPHHGPPRAAGHGGLAG
jgi:hypothetical protein